MHVHMHMQKVIPTNLFYIEKKSLNISKLNKQKVLYIDYYLSLFSYQKTKKNKEICKGGLTANQRPLDFKQ